MESDQTMIPLGRTTDLEEYQKLMKLLSFVQMLILVDLVILHPLLVRQHPPLPLPCQSEHKPIK